MTWQKRAEKLLRELKKRLISEGREAREETLALMNELENWIELEALARKRIKR